MKCLATKRLAPLFLAAPFFFVNTAAGMAQQASDCAFLSQLAGRWTGRGNLQRTVSAEPEAVRCRLVFEWHASTRIITSTMDCRGIDLDFKLWGSISVLAPGAKLKGAFYGSEEITNVTATGQCQKMALSLHLKEIKPKAGAPESSDLTIALSETGDTLTNLIETRDPDSGRKWRLMWITFKR